MAGWLGFTLFVQNLLMRRQLQTFRDSRADVQLYVTLLQYAVTAVYYTIPLSGSAVLVDPKQHLALNIRTVSSDLSHISMV